MSVELGHCLCLRCSASPISRSRESPAGQQRQRLSTLNKRLHRCSGCQTLRSSPYPVRCTLKYCASLISCLGPIVAPVDDNNFDDAPLPMPGNIGPYRPSPSRAAAPPAMVHAPVATPAIAPVAASSLPPAPADLAQQLRDLATKAFHSAADLWVFTVPPTPQARSTQANAVIAQHWVNPKRRSLDAFFSLLWSHNISDAATLLQALALLHNLMLQGM